MNNYPFDFLELAKVWILQISFEAYLSATADSLCRFSCKKYTKS